MAASLRDAPLGQLIRLLSGRGRLRYPDEVSRSEFSSSLVSIAEKKKKAKVLDSGTTGQTTPQSDVERDPEDQYMHSQGLPEVPGELSAYRVEQASREIEKRLTGSGARDG